VAPTEAGEQFLTRVRPAFGDIYQALDDLWRRSDLGFYAGWTRATKAMTAVKRSLGQ
jgi:DNA-binding transcriptional LysR family regulator